MPKQSPIPGYELVRTLGINLATVYLARHTNSGGLVSLLVCNLESAEHFRQGRAPLAGLDHPNIIRVVGMGEFGDFFYCALEYVEKTLADRLVNGPLADEEVARLAEAVASALDYARDRGVSCHDLAPTTIFLTNDNVLKVSAFFRSEEALKSTNISVRFLAPEEVVPGVTGAPADVYRVGVFIYLLLTGSAPFGDCVEPLRYLYRVVHEAPVPVREVNPTVGRDLEAICMKCLAKVRETRHPSLKDLAENLRLVAQKR